MFKSEPSLGIFTVKSISLENKQFELQNGNIRILVEGLARGKITEIIDKLSEIRYNYDCGRFQNNYFSR